MARPDASTRGGGRSPPSETSKPPPIHGVRSLALFGSRARGMAGLESDLDFVVESEAKSLDARMDLGTFLERLCEARVDLVLMAHQLARVIVHVLAAGVPADRSSAEKARERGDERV